MKYYLLFHLVLLGGCGVSHDKELEQYVNRFYEAGQARNATIPPMAFILRFKGLLVKCSKPQICLDEKKWLISDETQKEMFVFGLLSKTLLSHDFPDVSATIYDRYREEILDDAFKL